MNKWFWFFEGVNDREYIIGILGTLKIPIITLKVFKISKPKIKIIDGYLLGILGYQKST